ncbi:methyltransferase domain-containing protein [Candidatus Sulfurimonas baltica]|uniref:Methyltransferase domain-containing protein n=1 Tax=Candidatus Sulfurimonas baltica TaxID=2740404 RepID=A0A7S7LV93_9BACT|nr:methyltransferase domain-containing protein [Candidatus Sulfurimonas baltica]QOY52081.1 methyltransferase domain-containing protein [Candidatus Sulfurimonas baltica]
MKISSEFSKHALDYNTYNVIQNKVIEKLLSTVKHKPKNILDLGCGSGSVCKAIDWDYEHFTGVDFAPGMLELHPKSKKIESVYGDFNDEALFDNLLTYKYDYIFSASALQWANSLESVFASIKQLNAPVALAIFTSNTFRTLNETASISSLLRSADEVNELQKKYFNADFEILNYKLEFESTRDMFKYIKKSGVSGARKILSYKESKKLLNEYPLNYLEFEVAFIYTR